MSPDRELTKRYLEQLAKILQPRHAKLGCGWGCLLPLLAVFGSISGSLCGAIYGWARPAPIAWWDAIYQIASMVSLLIVAYWNAQSKADIKEHKKAKWTFWQFVAMTAGL